MAVQLSPTQLRDVYRWVDQVPLSRPKRNIARDFSDAVLMAEMVFHFSPSIVELHNYSATNSVSQKMYNWETLNRKVLRAHLGVKLSKELIRGVSESKKGFIETILYKCRQAVEQASGKNFQQPEEEGWEDEDDYMHPQHKMQKTPPSRKNDFPHMVNNGRRNSGGRNSGGRNSRGPSSRNDGRRGEPQASPAEMQETIQILQLKIQKLEQLLDLKNQKIDALTQKLSQSNKGRR